MQLVRAADRFYAVGAINQSIFGFRHAEPEGFERYRHDIAGRGRRLGGLSHNRPHPAEVLSAVETIVEGTHGIVKRPLVAKRLFPEPRDVCVEILSASEMGVEARWRSEDRR